MNKLIVLICTMFTLSTMMVVGQDEAMKKQLGVAQHLQDISVTIRSGSPGGGSEGSGVIFNRDIDGKKTSFVWTAAHVISNAKNVKDVIDSKTGSPKKQVTFKDIQILKELVQDGRRVGEVVMDAEVIKYSDADDGEDLALLMVRKQDFSTSSCEFFISDTIPPISTQLFHVGSLLGQMGANSMTMGIISQIGRVFSDDGPKGVFDQTTATAFPGSSGGGVFLTDGKYIGMLTRGAGEGFNFIVPIRRIKEFCQSNNLLWAIDPTVKTPPLKDIRKIVIDDSHFGGTVNPENHGKNNGFLVRKYIILNVSPEPLPSIYDMK